MEDARKDYGMHVLQPILLVPDVAATAAWYQENLGFQIDFLWGDPPTHGRVSAARDVAIQFHQSDAMAMGTVLFVHLTEDMDGMFRECQERGMTLVEAPEVKPWGTREFQIEDCNGYRLRFAIDA